MQKKQLRTCLGLALSCVLALTIAACGKTQASQAPSGTPGTRPVVYASFFPVKDLTERIVGDKMEVRSIIQGNQEPHDFELQTSDMAKISQADLIVYNGAGMEAFIDDLKASAKSDDKFLDLSQGLTLLEGAGTLGDDHSSVNPHTWLSVRNAQLELKSILDKVCEVDPANRDFYQANYETALAQFKGLDEKFERELSQVPADRRYFVVSHAAFNYLAHDYGLRQVAVTGISPEDEPSANQLSTIADFVRQHGITTIFFEGKATPKVAETLAKNTGTKTSTLYTMESLTSEEQERGYLQLMEENLAALMGSFNG
ncbi:metal ABC transporter solute-binding protein, Zn/Mn family [Olsenella urininfantis]|uniref:metal ABC transporter solute-binding protein, Zn/Mn family n=1 Tax=Olsenella urininfantis TaxID=1871033 RepID=UPI0009854C75|nr:zinc ABC transporter substrate-binding protein [Olsenella urininfantis]